MGVIREENIVRKNVVAFIFIFPLLFCIVIPFLLLLIGFYLFFLYVHIGCSFFGGIVSIVYLIVAVFKNWTKKDFLYIILSLVIYGVSITGIIWFLSGLKFF
jgi:hypothetical protein